MKRILLTISYNGHEYSGWQKQKEERTVQGEIEQAFLKTTGQEIEIFGSGRTDAGVHAFAQTAHFDLESPIPVEKIADILNGALPPDIRITKAEEVAPDFHARFSIKKKTYVYYVLNTDKTSPFDAYRYGVIKKHLDEKKMQEVGNLLEGEHNFRGFCSAQTSATDFVRKIFKIKVDRLSKQLIAIKVCGNGFLYNMVRIIVGTMVDYALDKITIDDVKKALFEQDRSCAGQTMPPDGLYLLKTEY